MATFTNAGDSIECNGSTIAVRKISDKPTFLKMESVNGDVLKLFKYKSKIRAIVKITTELNPKESIVCETSKLDLNDCLDADVIEIYTPERISFDLVSNFSHVHGIQGNQVNDFIYAKIVLPWRFVLERAATAIGN